MNLSEPLSGRSNILITIDNNLKVELQALAKADNRNLKNYIETTLQAHVKLLKS